MIYKALLLIFITTLTPAMAGDQFSDQHHKVELISGYSSTGKLNSIIMGLHFNFSDHWKTYWRYGGTAGYPIKINTTGSVNVKSVEINWPAPDEFTVLNLKAYGYDKEVVLPLTIVLENPGKDTVVQLGLDYLVCDPGDCVRVEQSLRLDIPAHNINGQLEAEKSQSFDLIRHYLERVPLPDTGAALSIDRVELSSDNPDYQELIVYARNVNGFKSPTLFIEPHMNVYIDFPQTQLSSDSTHIKFTARVYANELKKKAPTISLMNHDVTFTLVDNGKSIEASRLISDTTEAKYWSILILGIAFIGGFILNFMPCVLPVILIKVLSILQQAGIQTRIVRYNFLLTVAGILASFLLLSVIAISLRSLGFAVGWGSQFQEPIFLISIMLIILLFAYNLLGLFEITLSSSVATKLVSVETKETPMAHFFSGAFVTILATPCSAPFLGTALSYALSRGTQEILIIFVFMGLGLAFPFIIFAAFPGLVKLLPKPGMWMETFKKLLSIPLFATIAWLMWTLQQIVGLYVVGVLIVLFGLTGIVLLLNHRKIISSLMSFGLIIPLSLSSIASSQFLAIKTDEIDFTGTVWNKFDETQIKELVKAGKVVFVDVTANWCLTCKANELFVLDTKEIQELLKSHDVYAMQADWTNNDKSISAYLKRYNKYGIPFSIVYGPKFPDGKPMPELLTTHNVKTAIAEAK